MHPTWFRKAVVDCLQACLESPTFDGPVERLWLDLVSRERYPTADRPGITNHGHHRACGHAISWGGDVTDQAKAYCHECAKPYRLVEGRYV